MRKCAILIPNYNGEGFIADTVYHFLVGFKDYLIIVVDDSSTDKSTQILNGTGCILLKRNKNGGFGAAINTGFRYLIENGFEYVLVANSDLNIDMLVAKKIKASLTQLESNFKVGVLGYCESGSMQCGADKDISGFLFALRLNIINQVGYFDETFIMYGEEQDFFRRVLAAGFRIDQTGIQVQHRTEGSGGGGLKSSWLAIRNALYLETKRHLWWQTLRVCGILFLTINRIYYPKGHKHNPSYRRIIRPGIILGNFYLLSAILWNLKKTIQNYNL